MSAVAPYFRHGNFVAMRAKSGYLSCLPCQIDARPELVRDRSQFSRRRSGGPGSLGDSDTLLEKLMALWNVDPLWIAIGALIAVALAIGCLVALRTAHSAARNPAPAPLESDEAAVDSSHIGFAPLVSDTPQRGHFDAETAARGENSGGGHR